MMASLAFPVTASSEFDLQCGIRRQVSALLRRARNPRALAAMPLMNAICSEMGTANPVSALERVVRTVFDGDDRVTCELREAILKADFARETTNSELARRSGVSRRHFQRRRAEAVAAIAQYARGIVERSAGGLHARRDANGALAVTPSPGCFEAERQAFLEARDRDAALEMRAIAGNLMRLADNRARQTVAASFRAEANVRLGRRDEAKEHFAMLSPAARGLLAARLALLDGDREAAAVYARAALPRFEPDDAESARCRNLLAHTAVELPPQGRTLLESAAKSESWSNVASDVEDARRLARAGRRDDAARLALAAYRCAQRRAFAELEAQAAAIVQAAALARQDFVAARWWRALAVERLLPTQDRLLAIALGGDFESHRALGMDTLLTSALYQRLTLVVPQIGGESGQQAAAISDLLACMAGTALASGKRWGPMMRALHAVRLTNSAFADYCAPLADAITETMALALTAISGRPWDEVFAVVREVVGSVAERLRPVQRRSIAVAVPRSQPAALVHFRVNDERPDLRDEPVEALADLRLRLVSV